MEPINNENMVHRRPVAGANQNQEASSPQQDLANNNKKNQKSGRTEDATSKTIIAIVIWLITFPFRYLQALWQNLPGIPRFWTRRQPTFGTGQLLTYDELPGWLQDNSYILYNYRPELSSYLNCFLTIFTVHNETFNIWSHLVPGFVNLYYYRKWLVKIQTIELGWEEYITMNGFFVGTTLCFFFSALYHTLSCHSYPVLQIFLKFDYAGIIFMVFGSYFPWIYYAYYCDFHLRMVYYSSGVVVAAIVCAVCLTKRFDSVENRPLRAWVFVLMTASCFTAIFHYYLIYGSEISCEKVKINYIMYMACCYLIGGFIYGTRIPERYFPQRLRILGHSHQIFHICVILGAIIYYNGLMQIFDNREYVKTCEIT